MSSATIHDSLIINLLKHINLNSVCGYMLLEYKLVIQNFLERI